MQKSLVLLLSLALVLVACGDDGDGNPTGPSAPADISGSWNLTDSFSNSQLAVSCYASGALQISQASSTFNGSFDQDRTCTDATAASVDYYDSASITAGQISGSNLTFRAGFCDFSGSISGSPPNRLSGDISCSIDFGGQNLTFTGDWAATR